MSGLFYHLEDYVVVCMLAFVGGFVDAAGYYKLQGLFTSSITGNLVVACASVSTLHGVICRSLVSISFTVSGGISTILGLRMKRVHKFSVGLMTVCLFGLELAMLIIAWIVGLHFDNDISKATQLDQWQVVLVGCLMSSSMGFHNLAAKEAITNCPPTTVMTSTLINFAGQASSALYFLVVRTCGAGAASLDEVKELEAKYVDFLSKFIVTTRPLFVFLLGAVIGAITMERGTFWCLSIPIFVVTLVCSSLIAKLYFPVESKGSDSPAVEKAVMPTPTKQVETNTYLPLPPTSEIEKPLKIISNNGEDDQGAAQEQSVDEERGDAAQDSDLQSSFSTALPSTRIN